MTREQVEAMLLREKLTIAEEEKAQIAAATRYLDVMTSRVRRARAMNDEPAHIFIPNEPKE